MNILLATDGSECAATAGRLLAALPLDASTRVTVLCAAPEPNWIATPPLGAEGSLYPQMAELASEQQAAALRIAEEAAGPLRERGATVAVTMRRQSPAEAILDQVKEDHTDLVVVGSHGLGALGRFLLGSVSERVARYAPCSVLVARGDSVSKALVAVDGSESSEHALDAMEKLPLPKGLPVTVLHVIRPSDLTPPAPLMPNVGWANVIEEYDHERHAESARIEQRSQARLRHMGQEVSTDTRTGAPADEILASAKAEGANLIVVGAANRSALGRLLIGSVSGRVLHHASCSVLIARSG